MRPVATQFPITMKFDEFYPEYLRYLTIDGKHKGVDYGTPKGTAVFAAADGILYFKGFLRGYGNCVIVKWSEGAIWGKKLYRIILAHLDKILIPNKRIGDKISKYDQVGMSGASGAYYFDPAQGKVRPFFHLHSELQVYLDKIWVPVDPEFVLGMAASQKT